MRRRSSARSSVGPCSALLPDAVTAADSIERAIRRTVLASRCLTAAAQDVGLAADDGLVDAAAVDVLQIDALRVVELVGEIEGLRG